MENRSHFMAGIPSLNPYSANVENMVSS